MSHVQYPQYDFSYKDKRGTLESIMAADHSSQIFVQFYKRTLPDTCIPFGSEEGKEIFIESLLSGTANIYFPLAEQFRTQTEPAYCGLSTLVMVLNALAVDPQRLWKGPWRWYHEEMLECCLSLDVIQQEGITMEQFVCLSTCNNLDVKVVRINDRENIDAFREVVREICSGNSSVLVCSYSRKVLGQSGDGHFSPIGGFNEKRDMVLIMDVARFKYPPHWVKLEAMWEAMKTRDSATGLQRGYMVMHKSMEVPLLFIRLSKTFRVTIASNDLLSSHMAQFLKSWREVLKGTNQCSYEVCNNVENAVKYALESLNKALAILFEGESIFVTIFNIKCRETLPKYIESFERLLKAIEELPMYQVVCSWVKEFKLNNQINSNVSTCTGEECCRIDRVGYCLDEKSNLIETQNHSTCSSEVKRCCEIARSISDGHYITMLLLSWPYNIETFSNFVTCLSQFVDKSLENAEDILLNETKHLRQQIKSLILMVKSHDTTEHQF